jgi:hypothetical protein
MIWLRLAGEAANWSSWLWQNRGEFAPILRRVGDAGEFARAAIADPDGAVRRVGGTLVFGTPDGGQQVLAFVEQTRPRIEAVGHAVDGLQAGQAAVAASLGTLQQLSMVTLGLSALTPLVLGAQFLALGRKLDALKRQLAQLHKKFDAAVASDLNTGLDLLRQGHDLLEAGDRASAHNRLAAALPPCIRTMKYYGELLGGELSQRRANLAEVRLLARYLSVAVLGVASSQTGLEQDRHAFAPSGQELDLLRQAARVVFRATVCRDLPGLVQPSMREHGVTIEFLARLYRHARDAGAADADAAGSPPAWFEAHRGVIVRSAPARWWGRKPRELLAGLATAVAAIEETNRVLGLSRLVQHLREAGRSTAEIMGELRAGIQGESADASPYAVWGLGEAPQASG